MIFCFALLTTYSHTLMLTQEKISSRGPRQSTNTLFCDIQRTPVMSPHGPRVLLLVLRRRKMRFIIPCLHHHHRIHHHPEPPAHIMVLHHQPPVVLSSFRCPRTASPSLRRCLRITTRAGAHEFVRNHPIIDLDHFRKMDFQQYHRKLFLW